MTPSLELELWSAPGQCPDLEFGQTIESQAAREVNLPSGVVLGLSYVPDLTDVRNLEISLSEGELSETEFLAFCRSRKLEETPQAPLSAARFLEFVYGRALAWVHLPISEEGRKYFTALNRWVNMRRLSLQEPFEVYCLLANTDSEIVFAEWFQATASHD